MKCPVCNTIDLVMTDRQGVEIDYCPQCRGIWLDRGELDKIIERSASYAPPTPPPSPPKEPRYAEENRSYEQKKYRDDSDYDRGYEKRKKKSFLGDLFDFGD